MKVRQRPLFVALAVPLAGVYLASLTLTTVTADEPLREGQCENAQELFPDNNPGPGTLKAVPVPEPTNLSRYVRNRGAAIALGKALFWDMQVGSDGVTACASCHFRAGADPRSINQLNPGGIDNPALTLDLGGPNYQLKASDFPLHKVTDPTDRTSPVLRSIDDVVSSQGVHLRQFVGVTPGAIKDATVPVADPVFNVGGVNTRRAEPRNTPTMINAAFHHRNFWDVRARNLFNGVNGTGAGDENARVLRGGTPSARILLEIVRIDNASLASQAVEPPVSDREMGAIGRTFKDIGKRLAPASPLRQQQVSYTDSVLAPYVDSDGRGLGTTYRAMIEAAFQPLWWQAGQIAVVAQDGSVSFITRPNRPLHDNEYTMLEYNFALYFGLSVQLYEMTLIANDAPLDRYFDGQTSVLTAQELRGMDVFIGENAACAACHAGAETTNNSSRILFGAVVDGVKQPAELVERMFNGECEVVAYDQSTYNIGIRPTEEDLGIGNDDPFGNPLAFIKLLTLPSNQIPAQELLTYPIPNIANPPIAVGERWQTDGAFKVPTLRNLELTAPYFHNGGQRTIREVVEFYNRGGDFRDHNVQNIDFEIGKLNLTEQEIQDLVVFLGRPLTDPRVATQKAPFDHPQLFVPNGHRMLNGAPEVDDDGVARDNLLEIPAVGRNGGPLPAGFLP